MHASWVVEWGSVGPAWSSVQQALHWRDPQSSFWWLLMIAAICAAIAVWRRRWGAALWLLGSSYLALQHVRLQGLFACVVVVVGRSILQEARKSAPRDVSKAPISNLAWGRPRLILTAALIALAGFRSFDLISNRYYLRSAQLSLFGSGLSWWFPERAM